jgi:ABC-type multidrug transport system fused ATPase/permease subunit
VHKLHLLEMFDAVYVFDDGSLVERGSFDELIASNGALARMWRHYQASEPIVIADNVTIVEIGS